MKTLSEELNIRIVELYYKKQPPIYKKLESVRSSCKVYFCFYEDTPKKKFLRIGLMNPSKKTYSTFISWCKKHGRVKTWNETGNPHMELMKFLAFDNLMNFNYSLKEYEGVYNRMRAYDYLPNGLPRPQNNLLTYQDYTQFLHHWFNMSGMSYNQEVFVYRFAAAALDASHKYHIDEAINKGAMK